MISIKRRLMAWLLGLLVLSAAITMAISYRQYQASIGAFMDGQMRTLANSYAHRAALPTDVSPVDAAKIEHDGGVVVQFWGLDGRLLFSSWPIRALRLQPGAGFRTLEIDGHSWRTFTAPPGPFRVQVVQSNVFRRKVVLDSALKSAEPIMILIPITVILLWLAVSLALRPMDRVVQAIVRQDERSLAEVPLTKIPQELVPLIKSMNGLLLRLKDAFGSQQRFVQDAAHELRTPLTAVNLQVESLRQKLGASGDPEMLRLEGGVQRLQRLVEQLLRLAHREAAPPQIGEACVDLREVLKHSFSDLIPLAERNKIDLGMDAPDSARARIDAIDLRMVFDNLLDNALHYTPAGGTVDVTLRVTEEGAVVKITDTGSGIPPALLDRVFDRFYRVLGTDSQGSGLGLAIARSAANRGGFSVELSNRTDRGGLVACVRFSGLSVA